MKLYNRIFLVLCIVIVLCGMLISPIQRALVKAGVIEYDDRANYIEPEVHEGALAPLLNLISYGQAEINDTYTNYIPLYNMMVDGTANLKYKLNRPINTLLSNWASGSNTTIPDLPTDPLPDGEVVLLPKTLTANYVKTEGRYTFFTYDIRYSDGTKVHFLDKIITTTGSKATAAAMQGAENINRLKAGLPDVNFYVYVCPRIAEADFRDSCMGAYKGGKKLYMNTFINYLDDAIGCDVFEVGSIEEKLEKLYLTDHHWNAAGLYEAYQAMISMMGKNFTDISSAREPVSYHRMEDHLYYGTYARDMAYFDWCDENDTHDVFDFYDFGLPEHTQEGGLSFASAKDAFLSNDFRPSKSTDFYTTFYKAAEKYVYPENDTGHNLLIIGDSFAVSVSELLASHYDTTYYRDIRYLGGGFDLKAFVAENGITDILFLQNTYQFVYGESQSIWDVITCD